MRPSLLYRTASVLLVLFAAGHTLGFRRPTGGSGAESVGGLVLGGFVVGGAVLVGGVGLVGVELDPPPHAMAAASRIAAPHAANIERFIIGSAINRTSSRY